MIVEVGRWVLVQACRQGAAWRSSGYEIGIAVNVSARQLETDEFVDEMASALSDSGLEPSALTLELTETAVMTDAEASVAATDRDQAARSADRDRRLRRGLLVARLPAALPGGRAEDRPLVHRPPDQRPRRREADPHARPARRVAVDRDPRRGNRAVTRSCRCSRRSSAVSGQGFLFARPLDAATSGVFLHAWLETEASPEDVSAVRASLAEEAERAPKAAERAAQPAGRRHELALGIDAPAPGDR